MSNEDFNTELEAINIELTAEQQETLDNGIIEYEKKVDFFNKLRTHTFLSSLILLIAVFIVPATAAIISGVLSVTLILISLKARRKVIFYSHILCGIQMPNEDLRDFCKSLVD